MSPFAAETYQNEYLPIGGEEVNAVVTVTSTDHGGAPVTAEAAEIIIVDTSGSMADPRSKLKAARTATQVAIDAIRDGVAFGVIAGAHEARQVFPEDGGLVTASEATRASAQEAVRWLDAAGGTAIGEWLKLAYELFSEHQDRICHAILLTDGEDRNETPMQLDRVLGVCEGHFQCDCRGVGVDWRVRELRRIASALLGTVDIIAEPDDMAEDFRSMMEAAMGKQTGSVSLRLWTPQGAAVKFVRQVSPAIEDLTARASAVNPQTSDYPLGAWGAESRDYHVSVHVPAREVGDEMLAGRVSLVVDDEVTSQSLVKATWTDDERLSTRINPEVAHYTGQTDLADAIQEGLEARKAGDEATATLKLGKAVKLAAEGGNDATMRLLQGVVEIDDAATGTVRLKRQVDDADEMALDTRSTKTVRVSRPSP
jgi:hypothetical protein